MPDKNLKIPIHINLILTLFGLILFFYVLVIGAGILIPVVFSFVLALFLFPLCKRLEKFLPRWLSIFICLLLIILVLTVLISVIYSNLLTFSDDFPKMAARTMELINNIQTAIESQLNFSQEKQLEWLNRNLNSFFRTGTSILNDVMNSAATFFTYMLLIPIYAFFMLSYRGILKEFIKRIVVDKTYEEKVILIEEQIITVIQKYITGLVTVILIVSVFNIVGLWAIGIQHAVFFGGLAAILTIIPYIGVFIGSLLPILYALVMTDSLFYPIAVFIWFQIVQALEGNLITPNIVGSQVSLNPLVAILALLVGASVWGIAGMILFTLLTAMLKVFLDNIPALAPYGYLLSEGDKKPKKTLQLKKSWFYKQRNNTVE